MLAPTQLSPLDVICPTCSDQYQLYPISSVPHRLSCGHVVCEACAEAVAATPCPACPICAAMLSSVRGHFSHVDVGMLLLLEGIPASTDLCNHDAAVWLREPLQDGSAPAITSAAHAQISIKDEERVAGTQPGSSPPVSEESVFEKVRMAAVACHAAAAFLSTVKMPQLGSLKQATVAQFDTDMEAYSVAMKQAMAALQSMHDRTLAAARRRRDDCVKHIDAQLSEVAVSMSQLRAAEAVACAAVGGTSGAPAGLAGNAAIGLDRRKLVVAADTLRAVGPLLAHVAASGKGSHANDAAMQSSSNTDTEATTPDGLLRIPEDCTMSVCSGVRDATEWVYTQLLPLLSTEQAVVHASDECLRLSPLNQAAYMQRLDRLISLQAAAIASPLLSSLHPHDVLMHSLTGILDAMRAYPDRLLVQRSALFAFASCCMAGDTVLFRAVADAGGLALCLHALQLTGGNDAIVTGLCCSIQQHCAADWTLRTDSCMRVAGQCMVAARSDVAVLESLRAINTLLAVPQVAVDAQPHDAASSIQKFKALLEVITFRGLSLILSWVGDAGSHATVFQEALTVCVILLRELHDYSASLTHLRYELLAHLDWQSYYIPQHSPADAHATQAIPNALASVKSGFSRAVLSCRRDLMSTGFQLLEQVVHFNNHHGFAVAHMVSDAMHVRPDDIQLQRECLSLLNSVASSVLTTSSYDYHNNQRIICALSDTLHHFIASFASYFHIDDPMLSTACQLQCTLLANHFVTIESCPDSVNMLRSSMLAATTYPQHTGLQQVFCAKVVSCTYYSNGPLQAFLTAAQAATGSEASGRFQDALDAADVLMAIIRRHNSNLELVNAAAGSLAQLISVINMHVTVRGALLTLAAASVISCAVSLLQTYSLSERTVTQSLTLLETMLMCVEAVPIVVNSGAIPCLLEVFRSVFHPDWAPDARNKDSYGRSSIDNRGNVLKRIFHLLTRLCVDDTISSAAIVQFHKECGSLTELCSSCIRAFQLYQDGIPLLARVCSLSAPHALPVTLACIDVVLSSFDNLHDQRTPIVECAALLVFARDPTGTGKRLLRTQPAVKDRLKRCLKWYPSRPEIQRDARATLALISRFKLC